MPCSQVTSAGGQSPLPPLPAGAGAALGAKSTPVLSPRRPVTQCCARTVERHSKMLHFGTGITLS